MSNNLNIPILLATARKGRQSEKVAKYTLKKAREFGFESEIVDVKDYMTDRTIPAWEDQTNVKTWREIMQKAEGLIIVIPEYNHGVPGEFKIVFDQLFEEYKRKPVSICAVSSGSIGGARVIEQVWQIALAVNMVPTSQAVHFPNVKELFDENGEIKDKKQDERMGKMLEETKWFAEKLRVRN